MVNDFVNYCGMKRYLYERDKTTTRRAFYFTTQTFHRDVNVLTTTKTIPSKRSQRISPERFPEENAVFPALLSLLLVSRDTRSNESYRTNSNGKYYNAAISAHCKTKCLHVVYDSCFYNVAPLYVCVSRAIRVDSGNQGKRLIAYINKVIDNSHSLLHFRLKSDLDDL